MCVMGIEILDGLPSVVVTALAVLGVTGLAFRGMQVPRRMKQSELRRRVGRLLQEGRTSC